MTSRYLWKIHGGTKVQKPVSTFIAILMPDLERSPDVSLIASLARLWPNREHESNAVAGLLCRVGIHYWRRLDTSQLAPGRDVRFCFWCSKIELDGVIHNP